MSEGGRWMGNSCLNPVLAEQAQHMQLIKLWESGNSSALSGVGAGPSTGIPLQEGSACSFKPSLGSSP